PRAPATWGAVSRRRGGSGSDPAPLATRRPPPGRPSALWVRETRNWPTGPAAPEHQAAVPCHWPQRPPRRWTWETQAGTRQPGRDPQPISIVPVQGPCDLPGCTPRLPATGILGRDVGASA